MTGVQLIGKDQVIETFGTLNAKSWALYQGRQFIVGGIGVDNLDAWLTNFASAGSTATYTLRVYDVDEIPTSATGNSDYIACISFKIVDPYDGAGIHGHNSGLTARIGALEKQLKERDDGGGEEEDLNDIFMGWLSDPVKLNQVAGAIKTIFGAGGGLGEAPAQLQAVAGVEPSQVVSQTSEADLVKMEKALDRLGAKDKNLTKHLTKLADLSESNPALFQTVLTQLDTL